MGYSISKVEQETTINFNAAEKIVYIDTIDPVVIRKFDKLCAKCPEMYQLKREDKWGTKYYEIADKKLLSFRTPQVFSEERKQHMKGAANLQAWREAQKRMSGEESSKL